MKHRLRNMLRTEHLSPGLRLVLGSLMLFTNLVQRVDAGADALRSLEFQWMAARKLSIPTTTLLTYPALDHPEALALIERCRQDKDELGLHLHSIGRAGEKYGVKEPILWLWPRQKRIDLISEMIEKFATHFGHPPSSIGGYIIDAWTLRHLKLRHPCLRTAITSCFEEGVKMFYGNNRNWLLFSDGGPWNPYYPSQENALIPASSAEEAIDIVAIPHLNRDMIMALSSRDDWFASHPGNIFRAKINSGSQSPYLFRFFQEWHQQAALNGWSYLNIFVSSPWLSGAHWCIPHEEDVRTMYEDMLQYLVKEEEAGRNRNLTMADFGEAFRKQVPVGEATLCHWRDCLKQSKREVIWLSNTHFRGTWDCARGGALIDFRPYDGRLNLDLGPESEKLWNGNHPFLISTEHCGGHWNTGHYATITDGKNTANFCDRRFRAKVEKISTSCWKISSGLVRYQLGDIEIACESIWEMDSTARISIRRILHRHSHPNVPLKLTEIFAARWGTTEYPEDQRGVLLQADGHDLPLTYSGESLEIPQASNVSARIPQTRSLISLQADSATLLGRVTDARLFHPSFRLELEFSLSEIKETHLWLQTAPLTNL